MNAIPKFTLVCALICCCMCVVLCDSSYVSCTGIRTPENFGFRREGMHDLQTSPAEYQILLLKNWINISQKHLQNFESSHNYTYPQTESTLSHRPTPHTVQLYNCVSTCTSSGNIQNSGVANINIKLGFIFAYESKR
jgi:hypothetical protein